MAFGSPWSSWPDNQTAMKWGAVVETGREGVGFTWPEERHYLDTEVGQGLGKCAGGVRRCFMANFGL